MSEAVEAISDAADVEGLACVAIRLALTPLILCTHYVWVVTIRPMCHDYTYVYMKLHELI